MALPAFQPNTKLRADQLNPILQALTDVEGTTEETAASLPAIAVKGLTPNTGAAAADNAGAINEAFGLAVSEGGGELVFPRGLFYANSNLNPKYTDNGIVISGQGIGQTILQQAGGVGGSLFRRASVDDANYALRGRLIVRQLTARGMWQTYQSQQTNTGLFNLSNFSFLQFDHVECLDSTWFSMYGDDNTELSAAHCRVQRSCRDAISFANARKTKYAFNSVIDCWDDGLTVLTDNSPATDYPGESHICIGNYLENSNGIKYLGARKLLVFGNQVIRPHGYGLFIRAETNFGQGLNDAEDVLIFGNMIQDVILQTKFVGGSSSIQSAIYIGSNNAVYADVVTPGATPTYRRPHRVSPRSNNVRSIACTTNGTGVITGISDTSTFVVGMPVSGNGIPTGASVGSIDSSSQITLADGVVATNSTTASRSFGGNAGGGFIKLFANELRQTKWHTALCSDWGVNSAPTGNPSVPNDGIGLWTDRGYQNIDMSANHERSGDGVTFAQALRRIEVCSNTINGFNNGIAASPILSSISDGYIHNNNITRFKNSGINLDNGSNWSGRIRTHDNVIDGDPLFEHSNRLGTPFDGTWDASNQADQTPRGINRHGFNGSVTNKDNEFANVNVMTYPLLNPCTIIGGNTYRGYNGAGVGSVYFPDRTDQYLIEDSDPRSATYGQPLALSGNSADFGGPSLVAGRYYTSYDAGGILPSISPIANRIVAIPFFVPAFAYVDQMAIRVTTAQAAGHARFAIYAPSGGLPHFLVKDFGEIVTSSTGLVASTALSQPILLNPGFYWLCVNFDLVSTLKTNFHYFDRIQRQRLWGGATDNVSGGFVDYTFTLDPASIADGGYQDNTGISIPGALVGIDDCKVIPPYNLQGLLMQSRISANDTGAVSFFNKTGGTVDLASSAAWVFRVFQNNNSGAGGNQGDFQITAAQTYGAYPAAFPAITRSAFGTEARILVRKT